MRLFFSLCVLIFLPILKGIGQVGFQSGLYFASSEVVKDKRTSLNLTPENPLKLTEGFRLDFDINLRKGDGYYGYMFRIISNYQENFDLVANMVSDRDNFTLVYKDEILCSFGWRELSGLEYGKWTHITFLLNLKEQAVELVIDGISKTAPIKYSVSESTFNFLFGISKYPLFESTDVCPMSLRNIQIFNNEMRLTRQWKLSRHLGDKVYDEISGAKAKVENPTWLINKHVYWENALEFKLENFLGQVYDRENSDLYFVDSNKILRYNVLSHQLDTIRYKSGNPYKQAIEKHLIFNPYTREIWSYSFGRPEISRFNLETHEWSESPKTFSEAGFAHQNRLISPIDSSLITLFGYGHYMYKSTVFNYKPSTKIWEQTDKSRQISPRYLAATGLLNNQELLVFGGYGSKTGRQELSPGYFNDLYTFNLKTFQFDKLMTYESFESPYLPGESLILDDNKKAFYTLIYDNSRYETDIRLAKFAVNEPTYKVYEDSIPFNFLDTDSWLNLYLSGDKKQLVASTVHNSNISLYTIQYPPLYLHDVYQEPPTNGNINYLLWGALAVVVVFGVFIIVIHRRKAKKSSNEEKINLNLDIQSIKRTKRREISSIYFFGGFQIYDESEVDITPEFSPILKQLFLILFLHTVQNKKGISSVKLDETLWYDKIGQSARNNRNVNISKLRSILEPVGNIEIINKNSFWKIEVDNAVYCDYLDVVNTINKSSSQELTKNEIYNLIGLLSYGEFLPNIQTEWIDTFKSSFESLIIEGLLRLVEREDVKTDYSLNFDLVNCISIFDSLNEEALAIKCKLLAQIGKLSIAQKTYALFCREYKKLFNSEYTVSFNEVIK